jgi:FHS family L-fucose permease-like MFS transporter
MTAIKTNYGALSTLVTVFFFWGFIAAGNGVFIPFCKNYFSLDQFQSQLVDFAFYGAYYAGALALFVIGSYRSRDLVSGWGYKQSIVIGLLISFFGAIAMILAVQTGTSGFNFFLTAFFILALGFSLQQTAANPFAMLLGDPATGSHRINLGGGINSFGTTIGPIVVALALFGATSINDEMLKNLGLGKVTLLYSGVGLLFLAAAALFYFSKKVPSGRSDDHTERAGKAVWLMIVLTAGLVVCFWPVFDSYHADPASLSPEALSDLEHQRMYWLLAALIVLFGGLIWAGRSSAKKQEGWGALRYPQVVWGMIAIFVYVGVEVTIQSNLGALLNKPEFGSLQAADISPYISMYWGSLMIGRWTGALPVFELKPSQKNLLVWIVPFVAFGLILLLNIIAGQDMTGLYYYGICILVLVLAFVLSKDRPAFTLTLFSGLSLLAMLIGIFSSGQTAIYAFLSGGLFCSVMWPCIFSLSLAGTGKYETQGSAFLIMMILGGAIIPPVQGKLADISYIGIHQSYWVTVLCFLYLMIFGWQIRRILKNQGIDYDSIVGSKEI